MRRLIFLGIGALASILLVAAVTKAAEVMPPLLVEKAKKEGKLVWWGTDSPKEASQVIKNFNQKYPFIKVEYTKGTYKKMSIHPELAAKAPLGKFAGDVQFVYQTPESRMLLAPGQPLAQIWNKLVHGM